MNLNNLNNRWFEKIEKIDSNITDENEQRLSLSETIRKDSLNQKKTKIMTTKIDKRLSKDLYIFLNDLSKNMFDCDDYDSLPDKQKEGIYKMVTELRKQILLQIHNIKNK